MKLKTGVIINKLRADVKTSCISELVETTIFELGCKA
jgi:hypothetical protein